MDRNGVGERIGCWIKIQCLLGAGFRWQRNWGLLTGSACGNEGAGTLCPKTVFVESFSLWGIFQSEWASRGKAFECSIEWAPESRVKPCGSQWPTTTHWSPAENWSSRQTQLSNLHFCEFQFLICSIGANSSTQIVTKLKESWVSEMVL